MRVDITDADRELLLQLLTREISETGPEIRHTRTPAYRDDLKAYKRRLRMLQQQLCQTEREQAAAAEPA